VLGACSEADETQRREHNLEMSIPKGSEILEHVPTKYGTTGYVIFEFRDECFMLYSQVHQRSVTRISCK